ncbi:MAG: hypothetical protein ACM3MG_05930 [Bacillota bacterium]
MKLHQSLISKVSVLICVVLFAGIGGVARAQDGDPRGLVEVDVPQDVLANYRDRRPNHGMYIGVTYEQFVPKNFVSGLDAATYDTMYGTDAIPLIGLGIDYKYNIAIGSLSLGVGAAMGSISDSRSGVDRKLEVTKYAVNARFTLDALMPEPYAAPYVGFSAYQMGVTDHNATTSKSETTSVGYAYTVGVLLQLDWIDYDAAKQATFNIGLENTFIDLYVTQYAKAGSDTEPNTSTDMTLGAGLRLEF